MWDRLSKNRAMWWHWDPSRNVIDIFSGRHHSFCGSFCNWLLCCWDKLCLLYVIVHTCSSSWVLTTLWVLSHWSATCSPPWPADVLGISCGYRWRHWTGPPRHSQTSNQHLWDSPPNLSCLRAERRTIQSGDSNHKRDRHGPFNNKWCVQKLQHWTNVFH